jgi:hypothetical protein
MVRNPQARIKRPRGRPTKPEAERKRGIFAMRMRDEMRAELGRRAAANGRSASEEAEALFELVLSGQGPLDQLLELAFGRESAALLQIIGRLMRDYATAADLAARRRNDPAGGWLASPYAADKLKAAIDNLLAAARPEGKAVEPADSASQILFGGIPETISWAVTGHAVTGDSERWGRKVSGWLEPETLERMKSRGYGAPDG